MPVALPLSPLSRHTNPSDRSAIPFTRSRLSAKSAMRGSSSGWSSRPILSSAKCRVIASALSSLLRRHPHRIRMRVRGILVDALLDLVTEVAQQPLHRPGCAVAEGADGVALDLGRDLHQHVDLALVGAALRHAGQHAPHPAHTLAAGRALAAALVLVEIRDAGERADDVGR